MSIVKEYQDDLTKIKEAFDFNKRIWFDTPYQQDVECKVHLEFDTWSDRIVKMICEEYL